MAEIDAQREIRRAVDSGKVAFGSRNSEKAILGKEGKLVIVSANAPRAVKERLSTLARLAKVPQYSYSGSGVELGSVCGKPFVVSAMVVKEPGLSKIMNMPETGGKAK